MQRYRGAEVQKCRRGGADEVQRRCRGGADKEEVLSRCLVGAEVQRCRCAEVV